MQISCRFNVSYKGQIGNKILKGILEMWALEMRNKIFYLKTHMTLPSEGPV
jgi:hypothetical protein